MIKCLRCNRPLKNKESIERGYGQGCWKKLTKEHNQQRRLEDFDDTKIGE